MVPSVLLLAKMCKQVWMWSLIGSQVWIQDKLRHERAKPKSQLDEWFFKKNYFYYLNGWIIVMNRWQKKITLNSITFYSIGSEICENEKCAHCLENGLSNGPKSTEQEFFIHSLRRSSRCGPKIKSNQIKMTLATSITGIEHASARPFSKPLLIFR